MAVRKRIFLFTKGLVSAGRNSFTELSGKYFLWFWLIMFFIYIIDYLPWIYPEEGFSSVTDFLSYIEKIINEKPGERKFFDPLILAFINILVDPLFAFIHFFLFYPKFKNQANYLNKNYRIFLYALTLIILGLFNSRIYSEIASSSFLKEMGWISTYQVEKVNFIRNFPEAVISMVLFTGYWSFYKRNEELEIDNKRLMRRGLNHDFKNIFSYLGNYYQTSTPREFFDFFEKLESYTSYLIYDRVKDTVKLDDEIKHVKNYMFLRTMKCTEQPKLIINIEGEISENKKTIVPGLLIEGIRNAIKHGEPETGSWSIHLDVSENKGWLSFKVQNRIPTNQKKISKDNRESTGIQYIESCLFTYYPNRHEFIAKKIDEFYLFKIKILL